MTLSRDVLINILTAAIFVFGLVQGLSIAAQKPVWNDEIYSQVSSVDGLSMASIWRGGVQEGNNAPLFYALQKSVCLVLNYKAGDLWHHEPFEARVMLRIMPVVFMSLGLAFLFWSFARTYSLAIGALAFLIALGTYLVWAYFAEARPYAMIFFGGALQSAALIQAFRSVRPQGEWQAVAGAHLFLALTTPLSVIQVAASGVMLWLAGYRKWWMLCVMVVLPLVIGFGYHQLYSVKYHYHFASWGSPLALIKSAIPQGRLQFLFIAPFILWFWARKNKEKVGRDVWLFAGWFFLTLSGYGLFLADLWFKQGAVPVTSSFEVSGRYMMSLAPLSVATMVVLGAELLRRPRAVWVKVLVWSGMLFLVLPRLVKVFRWAENLH